MKKKEFFYTGDEIRSGNTKYGTPVYDGIFECVGTNLYRRTKAQGLGTNLVRKNGRTFKVKGQDDIFTSLDWYRK